MPDPLSTKAFLVNPRLAHAAYNSTLLLLLLYHAWLGLAIRRARQQSAPLPKLPIKRHRQLGPMLAIMVLFGFSSGLLLVLLDTGNFMQFPLHFLVGTMIVLLLFATYLVSRKIRVQETAYRDLHFALGIIILGLYLIEMFLGLTVLL